MNRLLKFRVWDQYRSKWYTEPKELMWSQHGYREPYGNSSGVLFSMYHVDQEIFSYDPGTYDQYDKGRFILEQFTGLTDREGKEIYEGDIIRYHEMYHQYMKKMVYWDEVVEWKETVTTTQGHGERNETKQVGFSFYSDPTQGRIIGNIHENPTLLPA